MSKEEKRDRMLSMIADWQQSGKSKKAYCSENGINEATFYYWFSRSKEDGAASGRFIAEYSGESTPPVPDESTPVQGVNNLRSCATGFSKLMFFFLPHRLAL